MDWISDSGVPGDNYDPAFAAAYADLGLDVFAPDEEVWAPWTLLEGADPVGFNRVVDFRSGDPDRTILQVPFTVEGVGASRELIAELEALWGGDRSEITITGGDSLIALVTEELTSSQVVSVGLTTLAALLILALFFGVTQFRPALGLITIIPTAVTLVWVLGAMWVMRISYNMVTALITALTIGIGVDYTIHLTHRFLGGGTGVPPDPRRRAPGDDHHRRCASGQGSHHGCGTLGPSVRAARSDEATRSAHRGYDHAGADRRLRGASSATGVVGALSPLAHPRVRSRQSPPHARRLTVTGRAAIRRPVQDFRPIEAMKAFPSGQTR